MNDASTFQPRIPFKLITFSDERFLCVQKGFISIKVVVVRK